MRVGVIADTHIPFRIQKLPQNVHTILAGVDLVLHAGDVGDLAVLDDLATIAPVEAVYGNDEPAATVSALPFEKLLDLNGHRVLLTHGHDPDQEVEWALRRANDWSTKLDYWAERGRLAGVDTVIYGHTHVPMWTEHMGVSLINPGALSSGSFFHRHVHPSVAILELRENLITVQHVDLGHPGGQPLPAVDFRDGFAAAILLFHKPMYDHEVIAQSVWIRQVLYPVAPQTVVHCIDTLAVQCWRGERDRVTAEQFVDALLSDPSSAGPLRVALESNDVLAPFLPN